MSKERKERLEDFQTDLTNQIAEFGKFWSEHSEMNPDQFPSTMESAEWEEQFISWKDTYRY